ncbi:MAG: oxygen-independent coproporphyrinogen III oxidase, partial [Pseudomonadota bacterium]
MTSILAQSLASIFAPDALQRPVPRYTSYPTAPNFDSSVGPGWYAAWLGELAPETPLSLYVHIPFCRRVCWFCACRTQGIRTDEPLKHYLDRLEVEVDRVAGATAAGGDITQIHWGGGSPSMLSADDMLRLARVLKAAFPGAEKAPLMIEVDPRDMDQERLDALPEAGVQSVTVGVQDFAPAVQAAIGRVQGAVMTADVIGALRARGISSIGIDLIYGLPHQTVRSLLTTLEAVLAMAPERIALYGYAHVPWMARRQSMIDAMTLPEASARIELAMAAREMLTAAGYLPVGIDHFARPGDPLALAANARQLQRTFQGYTADGSAALLAFGASAIGRLPRGLVQNAPTTAAWQAAIDAGDLATVSGTAYGLDDRMRAEAIEDMLCHFRFDAARLTAHYGDMAGPLRREAAALMEIAPEGALIPLPQGGFEVAPA